jgi:hypothetical protein
LSEGHRSREFVNKSPRKIFGRKKEFRMKRDNYLRRRKDIRNAH